MGEEKEKKFSRDEHCGLERKKVRRKPQSPEETKRDIWIGDTTDLGTVYEMTSEKGTNTEDSEVTEDKNRSTDWDSDPPKTISKYFDA